MRSQAKAVSADKAPFRTASLLALALLAMLSFSSSASAGYVGTGSFGFGPGSADGEFNTPRRVAVEEASGNVFVVDSANNRIQVFKPNEFGSADYLTQFGSGELNDPYGIVISPSGGETSVYVSDAGNNRVVKYDSDEQEVPSFTLDATYSSPSQGSGEAQIEDFHSPLALAPNGDLWVADTGANVIKRFDASGTHVAGSNVDGSTAPSGAFTGLIDLAVDSSGDLLVVSATGDGNGNGRVDLNDVAFCSPKSPCSGVSTTSEVERFSSAGTYEGAFAQNLAAGAVGVESGSDNVLVVVAEGFWWAGPPVSGVRLFDSSNAQIDQFDFSEGANFVLIPGIAPSQGRAYVLAAGGDTPAGHFDGVQTVQAYRKLLPPALIIDPVDPGSITAHTATFTGTVDPEKLSTSYHFEYRIGSKGAWTSTSNEDAGEGEDPVEVSVAASGLGANSTYQLRLAATNSDGTSTTAPVSFTTVPAAPEAETLPAVSIEGTSARLKATVNSNGAPTAYYFEWGTTSSYGSFAPIFLNGSAGQGVAVIEVSEALHDLQPNTAYHFRIVAKNATGTTAGADQAFTATAQGGTDGCPNAAIRAQQGSQGLPDCRAYEQVTPSNKFGYGLGGNDLGPRIELGVDPGGERVSYVGWFPFPGAQAGSFAAFSAQRGFGWTNYGLFPAPGPVQIGEGLPGLDMYPRVSTPDQRTLLYWDTTTVPYGSLSIRRADGSIVRIVDAGAPSCALQGLCPDQAWAAGISEDDRHVVFASNQRLLPGLPPATPAGEGDNPSDILYEWVDDGSNGSNGTLRVVNRTNDAILTLLDPASTELGGTTGDINGRRVGPRGARHAISDGSDGHSRIFFQDPAPADPFSFRGNGDYTTIGGPVYMREDGLRTVELSAPEGANSPSSELRYLDASKDGSKVFFWSGSKLTDDPGAGVGIYRYDVNPSGGGDLRFLGTATALTNDGSPTGSEPPSAIVSDDGSRLYYQKGEDVFLNNGGADHLVLAGATIGTGEGLSLIGIGGGPGIRDDRCPSANVSPGAGQFFAFQATGPNGLQVYRYDAHAAQLERISTTSTASSDNYSAGFTATCNLNKTPREIHTRVMSDDGSTIFFDTPAPLVLTDGNGVIDTYEWHNGQVSLISGGKGPFASSFAGTDASGNNAFFVTRDKLAASDGDPVYDLYSARVNGGFPLTVEPSCSGEACQGTPSGAPDGLSSASASFNGAGNAKSRNAKKHPKKKHQKHGKKQQKKKVKKHAKKNQANHNRRANR